MRELWAEEIKSKEKVLKTQSRYFQFYQERLDKNHSALCEFIKAAFGVITKCFSDKKVIQMTGMNIEQAEQFLLKDGPEQATSQFPKDWEDHEAIKQDSKTH